MSSNPDKAWGELAGDFRRLHGLDPLTSKEVEEELKRVKAETFSEADIHAIVDAVLNERLELPCAAPELGSGADLTEIEEDMLQLNRNRGESDPETDAKINEHRRKALDDDDAENDQDEGGVEGGDPPAGEGR